jgi:hypothetical protein
MNTLVCVVYKYVYNKGAKTIQQKPQIGAFAILLKC